MVWLGAGTGFDRSSPPRGHRTIFFQSASPLPFWRGGRAADTAIVRLLLPRFICAHPHQHPASPQLSPSTRILIALQHFVGSPSGSSAAATASPCRRHTGPWECCLRSRHSQWVTSTSTANRCPPVEGRPPSAQYEVPPVRTDRSDPARPVFLNASAGLCPPLRSAPAGLGVTAKSRRTGIFSGPCHRISRGFAVGFFLAASVNIAPQASSVRVPGQSPLATQKPSQKNTKPRPRQGSGQRPRPPNDHSKSRACQRARLALPLRLSLCPVPVPLGATSRTADVSFIFSSRDQQPHSHDPHRSGTVR